MSEAPECQAERQTWPRSKQEKSALCSLDLTVLHLSQRNSPHPELGLPLEANFLVNHSGNFCGRQNRESPGSPFSLLEERAS